MKISQVWNRDHIPRIFSNFGGKWTRFFRFHTKIVWKLTNFHSSMLYKNWSMIDLLHCEEKEIWLKYNWNFGCTDPNYLPASWKTSFSMGCADKKRSNRLAVKTQVSNWKENCELTLNSQSKSFCRCWIVIEIDFEWILFFPS